LVLLSGALFGFFEGVVVAWVGPVLGTSGAYWIARLIGGASVQRLLAGHQDIIAKLHGRRSFLTLLRLRAIPLIPSLLLDYAAGAARMDYVAYVGATMLGSFTSTAIFVFLASNVATGLTTGAADEALLWSVGAGAVLVAAELRAGARASPALNVILLRTTYGDSPLGADRRHQGRVDRCYRCHLRR